MDMLKHSDPTKVMKVMRALNIVNACGVVSAGVVSFTTLLNPPKNESPVTIFFLSLYICVFGLMWILYEIRLPKFDDIIKKQFGFLYRATGRAFFILFVGSICLGVTGPLNWVGILVGIISVLNALFNFYVIIEHPGFQLISDQGSANNVSYTPPPGNIVATSAANPYAPTESMLGSSEASPHVKDIQYEETARASEGLFGSSDTVGMNNPYHQEEAALPVGQVDKPDTAVNPFATGIL
jgi:hypothetical protein